MPNYCPRCGKKVGQTHRFCPCCGNQLGNRGIGQMKEMGKAAPGSAHLEAIAIESNQVKNLSYASMAGFGALALISLLTNSGLGFLLGAAFAGGVYFFVLKKYTEGDYSTCSIAAMVIAIAAGLIGLVVLPYSPILGLVDILPAIPLFYVWRDLKDGQVNPHAKG